MKLLLGIFVIFTFISIPDIMAYENPLENTKLTATSATISLEIEIGQDTVNHLLTKTTVENHLSDITFKFYGDNMPMDDSRIKIYSGGEAFSIKNIEQGIVMYGLKTSSTESYRINIYLATNNGFEKFTVHSNFQLEDEKIIETIEEPEKEPYKPELTISESHDFSTYWKDTFNIEVKTFDAKINPSATGFEGKLNDVDITVIISLGDKVITTLKGITENGVWSGEHYIKENLVQAGEYTVDVLANIEDQTISKTSSMFIIGTVGGNDSTNHAPVAFAGSDDVGTNGVLFSLDGSGSSDSDGDTLTYSWTQTTSIGGVFADTDTATPDFTPSATGTAIFELTVTDPKGKSDTDTVTIVIS